MVLLQEVSPKDNRITEALYNKCITRVVCLSKEEIKNCDTFNWDVRTIGCFHRLEHLAYLEMG